MLSWGSQKYAGFAHALPSELGAMLSGWCCRGSVAPSLRGLRCARIFGAPRRFWLEAVPSRVSNAEARTCRCLLRRRQCGTPLPTVAVVRENVSAVCRSGDFELTNGHPRVS